MNDPVSATTLGEPVPTAPLTIFPALPAAADKRTFDRSLLVKSDARERTALVLYTPDLQNIACIDNTGSEASTSYARSVTTGFTLSTTVTFSLETSAEVTVEVVKASLKVGFSISFTAQYSQATTETMTFSVPPGKKAFLYQGFLRTVMIRHDVTAGTYAYDGSTRGRFLTDVLTTSPVPLTGPPKLAA